MFFAVRQSPRVRICAFPLRVNLSEELGDLLIRRPPEAKTLNRDAFLEKSSPGEHPGAEVQILLNKRFQRRLSRKLYLLIRRPPEVKTLNRDAFLEKRSPGGHPEAEVQVLLNKRFQRRLS